MRLHEFILTNREQIIEEWETFARSCAPASAGMDVSALRDHAREMLNVIALDLTTFQGGHEQSEKSKGLAPPTGSGHATAAEQHGAERAESGFTVEQMVAEYRALRASVLRLWTRNQGELHAADLEDLTRFNEAIDQALAESVSHFSRSVQKAKDMFLAMLGHDLRTPLGAIYTSAAYMRDAAELDEPYRTLTLRIASSAARATSMVGDLLDFTRSHLGGGIPVVRTGINLGKVVHEAVDEVSAKHPERRIEVDTREEQRGEWDAARMGQVLTNLIGNAVEYGAEGTTVRVQLEGDEENLEITVHNRGTVIPPERLASLFDPLKVNAARGNGGEGPTANLGLGLYIAERIVHAHGGRIEVESSEARGTTFTVRLPRRA